MCRFTIYKEKHSLLRTYVIKICTVRLLVINSVTVKVTRSLTLITFEMVTHLSMHAKYEVSIIYGSNAKRLWDDVVCLSVCLMSISDFGKPLHLSFIELALRWVVELNCLFNVTINDISVIYVTAHRCAGGLKKKYDLRSGSQRHRHFVGFFNVPVLAPTRDQPFYTVIPTHRPI